MNRYMKLLEIEYDRLNDTYEFFYDEKIDINNEISIYAYTDMCMMQNNGYYTKKAYEQIQSMIEELNEKIDKTLSDLKQYNQEIELLTDAKVIFKIGVKLINTESLKIYGSINLESPDEDYTDKELYYEKIIPIDDIENLYSDISKELNLIVNELL